jgi:pilus assembly protein CpaF
MSSKSITPSRQRVSNELLRSSGFTNPDYKEFDFKGLVAQVQSRLLNQYPQVIHEARSNPARKVQLLSLVSGILVTEGPYYDRSTREELTKRIVDEIGGYGPIEPLLSDPDVNEIMVNGPHQVFIERNGAIVVYQGSFDNSEHLIEVINRIVAPLGRRVDQSSPYVDARLPDGSRVNAIIPPLSLDGPVLTIRKFPKERLTVDGLVSLGTLNEQMAAFLKICVMARLNVVVSGGASSGKTTTLNALSSFIPDKHERIITIEDAAELRFSQSHVVRLESRPPNLEGKGEVTIRQLFRNALRMRPDRIVIGECRGEEAFDMVQALSTGHSGSMSTVHANSALQALRRIEAMASMGNALISRRVLSDLVRDGIDLIVHQERFPEGRRITHIALVRKTPGPFEDSLQEVFRLKVGHPYSRGTSGFEDKCEHYFERVFEPPVPTFLLQKAAMASVELPDWLVGGEGNP